MPKIGVQTQIFEAGRLDCASSINGVLFNEKRKLVNVL